MNQKVYELLKEKLPNYNKIEGSLRKDSEGGKPDGHCFMGALFDLAVQSGIVEWDDLKTVGHVDEFYDPITEVFHKYDEPKVFFNYDSGTGRSKEAWAKVWEWADFKQERMKDYGGLNVRVQADDDEDEWYEEEIFELNDSDYSWDRILEFMEKTGIENI